MKFRKVIILNRPKLNFDIYKLFQYNDSMGNRDINVLNDYFVRYLLASQDSNLILLDFINSIMLDSGMKIFRSVEILTPFNYKENNEDKETIVDVKCITQNGTVVII